MNEVIDVAFAGAKIASRNNVSTSLIVHGLSAGYNIGQIAHYRYMIAEYQMAVSNGNISAYLKELEQYKRELTKHTVLSIIDVVSLFCIGFNGLNRK
ncbi:MAG: hypothetical protein IK103_08975 [Bacteroidales bacterium]|nr:hypothetical protein [Bacteroidales bacterium]